VAASVAAMPRPSSHRASAGTGILRCAESRSTIELGVAELRNVGRGPVGRRVGGRDRQDGIDFVSPGGQVLVREDIDGEFRYTHRGMLWSRSGIGCDGVGE